jgi:hydrogenase maturation protein HypF
MIAECQAMRITVRGAVQGVGFRPFVYRLARELGLTGYVSNTAGGVLIELEGSPADLETFMKQLTCEAPPLARINQITTEITIPTGCSSFTIQPSQSGGSRTALVLPDMATCPDCLDDIFDPDNRRYRYPFTNCTNCGPRYSIILAVPYDRINTSMRQFEMCPECRAEYENPLDRRFHAQPNACPLCGPRLALWDGRGKTLSMNGDALLQTASAIREGRIVALKGLGGFQLLVDARNLYAVQRLRERKRRPDKPFAVMYPSLEMVNEQCAVSPLESDLLTSTAAPIVLVRTVDAAVAPNVAPGNPHLGVMLAYTPLHHLLMAELGFPIVATSGNLTDEPICIDELEALERLSSIADLFVVHNRPIVRQVDDSVTRVVAGREQVLRRARGYAPFPIQTTETLPDILGVGGHLKNTIAASSGDQVFISQHIGNLETVQASRVFERTVTDFEMLYDWSPQIVAHDLHPDYHSTHYASAKSQPKIAIQHHYAHVLACMAEHHLDAPALGVCWDGTGYGPDGTIWGGEWLVIRENDFQRIAHLRMFRLPGGEQAVKEPRRSAVGLLYEIYGDAAVEMTHLAPVKDFTDRQREVLKVILKKGINAPVTSSMGRLFDGVAALLGLGLSASFEGQAAMALEFAVTPNPLSYDFHFTDGVVDWEPLLQGILDDLQAGLRTGEIAAKFHNALAEMVVTLALHIGQQNVMLTGGCFQNKYLTERAIERLRASGFTPRWHQEIPPNDGGLALGQVMAAARECWRQSLCV